MTESFERIVRQRKGYLKTVASTAVVLKRIAPVRSIKTSINKLQRLIIMRTVLYGQFIILRITICPFSPSIWLVKWQRI